MREQERPRAFRIVVGFGEAVPGAHSKLACAAADRAKEKGLANVGFKRSKHADSNSFYLSMRDRTGRTWHVRISEHYRPRRSPVPQFDVVSRDGIAGRTEPLAIVDRIAAGTAPWFESEGTARPHRKRRRR